MNVHWCLDKLGKTGSTLQYINGIILLSTFFGVRICYGWYMVRLVVNRLNESTLISVYTDLQSYGFMHTLWEVKDQVPKVFTYTLFAGNIILNSLNLFWYVRDSCKTLFH